MFACYVSPDEFYAAYDVRQWIEPSETDTKLRNAAAIVANDLRSRGVDTSRLMPPTMLNSDTLYGESTETADKTFSAVTAVNVGRMVVEVTSGGPSVFTLEGSKDGTTYFSIRDISTGTEAALDCPGAGLYSFTFFEQYSYFKLSVETDDPVTFRAYLIDTSLDELIIFKTLETGLFLVLDADDRAKDMYDRARVKYEELATSLKFRYDADGDGSDDGEYSMQRRVTLNR